MHHWGGGGGKKRLHALAVAAGRGGGKKGSMVSIFCARPMQIRLCRVHNSSCYCSSSWIVERCFQSRDAGVHLSSFRFSLIFAR